MCNAFVKTEIGWRYSYELMPTNSDKSEAIQVRRVAQNDEEDASRE